MEKKNAINYVQIINSDHTTGYFQTWAVILSLGECFKKCVKDKTKVNNFAHEKKQKGIVDNSRLIQL
jgi:hypothetical protein